MALVTIVVSPLGSGHVTRQLALMHELLDLDPELRIRLVCTVEHLERFQSELQFSDRIEIRFLPEVPTFHISSADAVDIERTHSSFLWGLGLLNDGAYQRQWRLLLEGSDVVVNDIEFLHNPVAKSLGIPIVNISNFTWSDLLRGLGLIEVSDFVSDLESLGDLNLRLPFTTGCRSFRTYRDVGLLCREIGVTSSFIGKPFALFLAGNINHKLDIQGICEELSSAGLSCLVLGRQVSHANVQSFPAGLSRVPDIIGQSSVVVGKVGFSTVAEVYCAGVPFVHFQRQGFMEDQLLSDHIVRDGRGVSLDFAMDASEIADRILAWAGQRLSRVPNDNKNIAELVHHFVGRN